MNIILKNALLLIVFYLAFVHLKAQNIAITDDDTYTANPSAMLDIKSLTKGMLVPRLSTTQRNAVSSPATGLLVFDTDAGSFYFYNGTSWINLTSGNANGILGYTSPDKVYLTDITDKLGVGTVSPSGKMEVKSDVSIGTELPIFNVVNSTGDTVFAVYEQGVRINVYDDPLAKATSSKGGFAVGGFSPSKGTITHDYLRISPDSIRMYIEEGTPNKATASKGGFAVGGFSPSKSLPSNYFNIYGSSATTTLNPSQARIFWYPLKEALLCGRVLVESPDSVGTNSFASGFESKAIGNYSQALGNHARAFGNNSTAIGSYAETKSPNSYAFGNNAVAADSGSYAIGTGAQANGKKSFAIGSQGIDITLFETPPTKADGDYSYAFGMGSQALGTGSFVFGTKDTAAGDFSTAFGYKTKAIGQTATSLGNYSIASGSGSIAMGSSVVASGDASVAMGTGSLASGYASTAMGNSCQATGQTSFAVGGNTKAIGSSSDVAMGELSIASGGVSTAFGYGTVASGYISTAMGASTKAGGFSSTAMGRDIDAAADNTFGIGLDSPWPGTWTINQPNTMAVMGGQVGIGTVSPNKLLHVAGDARIEGDLYYGLGVSTYTKPDYVFNSDYSKKYEIFEIEEFIKKHKHLPWVTSAENDSKDGVNITRMTFETLESVENLQLQLIDLKKENEALKLEISEIKQILNKNK